MTARDLIGRIKQISEANRGISQLISKLAKHSPPSTTGIDEPDTRTELSSEIHQSLKELEEDFDLARQEAEDFASVTGSSGTRRQDSEKDREKVALASQIERLGEDLKLSRAQFRKAQLQAKRNAEAAKRKEREILFESIQEGNQTAPGKRRGQEKFTKDELALDASSDVTAALRRTHQLMQSELQRSQFAHQTLQRSTAALKSLNESYNTVDTLLSSSKSLISTLVSSQKSDTWYLETAFWILVCTIAWLIFRRLLYGPVRYIVYLPIKWTFTIFLYSAQTILSIITGSALVPNPAVVSQASSSSTLIVKPSATGRPHRINPDMSQQPVAAGGGGAGAKQSGKLSDTIGEMAEKTLREEHVKKQVGGQEAAENNDEEEEEEEAENEYEDEDDDETSAPRGTVLRERRKDEPPNPKKRMWEEPRPIEKKEKDEL